MSDTDLGKNDQQKLRQLKHDLRNQLSNIHLALEQLRYDLPVDLAPDCEFYMDAIANSCIKIDELLKSTD